MDRENGILYINTHTHIYTYILEYYLAIKKNKSLPFATTWMDLKGIMLSEIESKQRKTNTI